MSQTFNAIFECAHTRGNGTEFWLGELLLLCLDSSTILHPLISLVYTSVSIKLRRLIRGGFLLCSSYGYLLNSKKPQTEGEEEGLLSGRTVYRTVTSVLDSVLEHSVLKWIVILSLLRLYVNVLAICSLKKKKKTVADCRCFKWCQTRLNEAVSVFRRETVTDGKKSDSYSKKRLNIQKL